MPPPLAWFPLLAPLALASAALLPARDIRARLALARVGSWVAVAIAVALGAALVASGPFGTPTIGLPGVGIAVYCDALTGVMTLLVAFLGAIILRYSATYLDGDPGQGRFVTWLCLTLAAVLVLILSGNLLQLALAWIATSLALHRLLLFYPERPGAVRAARKKFVSSRLGDACVLGAALLAYARFGTLDIPALFAAARDAGGAGAAIAVLLAIAALLKSAQFPFHGWLTEVMETPTPVSALLHAGIINAGGFLAIRLSPLVAGSPAALDVLAFVGGFTALFAAVVMLTQNSVKVSLAWSTAAQMGFMLLQCGLGAFASATLHIVAHSLYKAHAFLSSGSVVDLARAAQGSHAAFQPTAEGRPHPWRLLLAMAAGVALTGLVARAFGAHLAQSPGVFALGAVLVMGLAHLLATTAGPRPSAATVLWGAAMAAAVAVGYFALQAGAAALLADVIPAGIARRTPLDLAIVALVIVSFGAVTMLQSLLAHRAFSPRWRAAYVHLWNGLYVNALADRLLERAWPMRKPVAHGEVG